MLINVVLALVMIILFALIYIEKGSLQKKVMRQRIRDFKIDVQFILLQEVNNTQKIWMPGVLQSLLKNLQDPKLLPAVLIATAGGAGISYKVQLALPLAVLLTIIISLLVLWLAIKQQQKLAQQQFSNKLPDVIEVFSRAVQAGVPVQRAILNVSDSFDGLVSSEFRKVYDALVIGIPFQQALLDSSKRVNNPSYHYFTAILGLNAETGGALVETLQHLSGSLREKSKVEKKMLALTAEPRMSARIVSAIPILLLTFQFVKNPQQIEFLINDTTGQKIISYALVSIVVGLLCLKRLTRI